MTATEPPAPETAQHRAVEALIVGAGQAGLGTGYWLARRTSASFLIVDAAPRPGQSWCDRWDSLTLFTPRRFSGPGPVVDGASMADPAELLLGRRRRPRRPGPGQTAPHCQLPPDATSATRQTAHPAVVQ